MAQEIHHKENERRGIFFMRGEKGIIAELTYTLKSDVMIVDHTETKRAFEGQGLGSMLIEHTVSYARENGLKIEPLCPFVEVKFDDNKAYNDVRA